MREKMNALAGVSPAAFSAGYVGIHSRIVEALDTARHGQCGATAR